MKIVKTEVPIKITNVEKNRKFFGKKSLCYDIYQRYKKGEISNYDYLNEWAKTKGFKDINDYNEYRVKKRGYKDYNEYQRELNYENRGSLPMCERKDSGIYLGVYIAESILSKLFKEAQKMPIENEGYDFICGKKFKIDVKSSCLDYFDRWQFCIYKNKIADYFLCIGFDSREKLNCLGVWLIKGDEVIRSGRWNQYLKKVNERDVLHIYNRLESLEKFKKYQMADKLDAINQICFKFKQI